MSLQSNFSLSAIGFSIVIGVAAVGYVYWTIQACDTTSNGSMMNVSWQCRPNDPVFQWIEDNQHMACVVVGLILFNIYLLYNIFRQRTEISELRHECKRLHGNCVALVNRVEDHTRQRDILRDRVAAGLVRAVFLRFALSKATLRTAVLRLVIDNKRRHLGTAEGRIQELVNQVQVLSREKSDALFRNAMLRNANQLYDGKLVTAEERIQELVNQVEEKDDRLVTANKRIEQLHSLEQDHNELKEKYQSLDDDNKTLSKEKSIGLFHNAHLRLTIRLKERKLVQANEQVQTLVNQVEVVTKKKDDGLLRMAILRLVNHRYKGQLVQANERIQSLVDTVEGVKKERDDNKTKVENASKAQSHADTQITALEEENKKLTKEKNDDKTMFQKEITRLQESNKVLAEEKSNADTQITTLQDEKAALSKAFTKELVAIFRTTIEAEKDSEIALLQFALNATSEERAGLEEENQELDKLRRMIEKQLEKLQARCKSQEQQIVILTNEKTAIAASKEQEHMKISDTVRSRIMELEGERDTIKEMYESQAESLKQAESSNKELKYEFDSYVEECNEEFDDLRGAKKTLSTENDALKSDNESISMKWNEEKSRNKLISEKFDEAQSWNQALQEEVKEKNLSLESLQSRNQTLQEDVEEKNQSLKSLQSRNQTLQAEVEEKNQSLESLQSRNHTLEQDNAGLEIEIRGYRNIPEGRTQAPLGSHIGPVTGGGSDVPLASPIAFAQRNPTTTTTPISLASPLAFAQGNATTTATPALGSPSGSNWSESSDGTSFLNVSDSIDGSPGTAVPPASRNTTTTTTMASPDSSGDSGFYFNDDNGEDLNDGNNNVSDYDDGTSDEEEEEFVDGDKSTEDEDLNGQNSNTANETSGGGIAGSHSSDNNDGSNDLDPGQYGIECPFCHAYSAHFYPKTFDRITLSITDVEFQDDKPQWVAFTYNPPSPFRGIHAFKDVLNHIWDEHQEVQDALRSGDLSSFPILFRWAINKRHEIKLKKEKKERERQQQQQQQQQE